MVKAKRPVDIYVRVSRVGGRERLISPDEQERKGRELAREQGLTVGLVLTDLDESGGKLERPGLQEALRRVEQGESGGVIVAWLDRLSRDSEHAHGLVRRISDAGGAIYAPDAPSDWTTPEGELQAGIVFAFATYVRKRARAGFERAKAQAIERGIPVNNRPAVGYLRGEDRRLVPDPDVAPYVREAFELRAAGAGPTEIARFLEANGVKTSQGSSTWSKQAIYQLIRNRVYLGELAYGKDRRFVNPNAHEPLIDLATFQAAQHPNGRKPPPAARSAGSPYLLTGLLRCHACRYSMQGTRTSRGKRIYRCTGRHAAGTCPAPARVPAEPVEQVAVDAFWSLTADLEAEGRQDSGGNLSALVDTLKRAERRLAQALTPAVQDAAGDTWAAMLAERRRERDEAAEELGQARAAAERVVMLPSVETLRDAWERMTAQERRELLALRFECFSLSRDRRLVGYPVGSGPKGLPRRGFTRAPELAPFPDPPDGARVLTL